MEQEVCKAGLCDTNGPNADCDTRVPGKVKLVLFIDYDLELFISFS